MKHNNVIPNVHLRKHWSKFVRTWFNQAARKRRRLENRREKAARQFPRPVDSLRPIVRLQTQRYNKRQRIGRGFTLEEIRKAKLTPILARSVGITVDHRRKNRNVEAFNANVQRLLAYKEKLILFPRTEGKPKKGLINDTTADTKTLQVTQNTETSVLGGPSVKLREKPIKLTKELKDRNAYRILRQERTNQKWDGRRRKRVEEKKE